MSTLSAELKLGYVHLTVSNLDCSLAFYQHSLGFQIHHLTGDTAYLGAGGPPLLVLTERRGAVHYQGVTGLYHFAILVPSRPELAQVINRVAETRTPVQGASDHLFSEALYLSDPDGNGIEIYRDRPRDEWPRDPRGQIRGDNLPLDLSGILGELCPQSPLWAGLPPQSVLGHMHLHVRNIPETLTFYRDVLGFDLMLDWRSALFFAAGGYHHHIGLNIWGTRGAPPAPCDAAGLRYFTATLPGQAEVEAVIARVRTAKGVVEDHPAGYLVRDPSGNGLVFTSPKSDG